MLENQIPPTLVLIQDLGLMFPTETSKQKKRYGLYRCICGIELKVSSYAITSGNTNSCGCRRKEMANKANLKHGLGSHKLYGIWFAMISRTSKIKDKYYESYGGRGITVCVRWRDVRNFIEDMEPTYDEGLTIDRINNNGNYELSNCRWTTKSTQAQNTKEIRCTNKSGYRGVSFYKRLNKWISVIGVNNKKVYLGSFNTAIEGAIAYNNYVAEHNLEHTKNTLNKEGLV